MQADKRIPQVARCDYQLSDKVTRSCQVAGRAKLAALRALAGGQPGLSDRPSVPSPLPLPAIPNQQNMNRTARQIGVLSADIGVPQGRQSRTKPGELRSAARRVRRENRRAGP